MATATKRRPRVTREERSNRLAELSARLEAFADSLDEDEQATYEARFDHYSPRNAMLIVMQMPDATVVRGFQAWLDEGRCVRKGEHGIQILAPAGQTGGEQKTEAAAETFDLTGHEEKVRRYFRIAHVFDISQTDAVAPKAGLTAAETARYEHTRPFMDILMRDYRDEEETAA
jgi:N-terminal domain of anti-restriction factor ArdC